MWLFIATQPTENGEIGSPLWANDANRLRQLKALEWCWPEHTRPIRAPSSSSESEPPMSSRVLIKWSGKREGWKVHWSLVRAASLTENGEIVQGLIYQQQSSGDPPKACLGWLEPCHCCIEVQPATSSPTEARGRYGDGQRAAGHGHAAALRGRRTGIGSHPRGPWLFLL